MIEWYACEAYLPEIDYDQNKSAVKVYVKNFGKIHKCHYRHITSEHGTYGIFYNLKDGTIYRHVTHWKPVVTVRKVK